MLDWVENFVKSLVKHPDQVRIDQSMGTKTVVVNLKVASDDRPLFEDKNQRLTRALNSIMGLSGARERIRYVLKVG